MKHTLTKVFNAMGTTNIIEISSDSPNLDKTAAEAVSYVKGLSDMLTIYNESSEISKINANAGIHFTDVSPDTKCILHDSVIFSHELNGDFAITVNPLTDFWKNHPAYRSICENSRIRKLRSMVNDDDIIFRGNTVKLKKKGQSLDLGSIAKGYAADHVAKMIAVTDPDSFLINFGGTVVSVGAPKRVGIRDPFNRSDIIGTIEIHDKACVTSGSYEQTFTAGGRTYSHIINAKTGYPAETDLVSVTAIGNYAEWLDALTTPMYIHSLSGAIALAKKYNVSAIFVTTGGKVIMTEDLKDNFIPSNVIKEVVS